MVKKTRNVMILMMIVIVFFGMLYSVFFLANNAHHDCTGENCPICEQLQVAENIVNKLSTAVISIGAAIFLCVSTQAVSSKYRYIFVEDSPIRLKVKMLD